MNYLFIVIAFLCLHAGTASLFDWIDSKDDETISVEAVNVKPLRRSLQTFTRAPTRKVTPRSPTNTPTRRPPTKPTPQPIVRSTPSPQAVPSTPAPADNVCVLGVQNPYECGDVITLNFDYSLMGKTARIDDMIAIYPCYINSTSYNDAEVWQWACGAPPLTPKTCTGPRAKGNVVFKNKPSYNGVKAFWPVAPNSRKITFNGKPGFEVNRCFKAVLIRRDGKPFSEICKSTKMTINENSRPNCSIRQEGSPSDS